MDVLNEKQHSISTGTAAHIERLKLDVEKNALVLATYQKEFDGISPSADVHESYMMRKLLSFIASAPVKLLHQLNKHLRGLTHRLLTKVQQGLNRLRFILAGDVIPFEDALGRRCNLPLAYFGHWGFMKPYMVYMFKGLPGEYQVRRGKYQLTTRRTGQMVDETNWKVLTRPDDDILMSVVSSIPALSTTYPECPACDVEILTADTSSGDIMCPYCRRTFSIPDSHTFVTPSDGDCRPVSMLSQKMVNTRQSTQADLKINNKIIDIECYEDEPSQTNVGFSQLKHVLVRPTNDPIQIIDSIEDLLDQISTTSPVLPYILNHHFPSLRKTLSQIRNESQLTNQLNYLDFETEHKQFMAHTRAVSRYLQNIVLNQTNKFVARSYMDQTPSPLVHFQDWVMRHGASPPKPSRAYPTQALHTKDRLVLLKTLTGQIIGFRLPPTTSIRHFKELVHDRERIPMIQQYLVYRGKALQDDHTIGLYDLGPKYYVYLLLQIWGPSDAKKRDEERVGNEIERALKLTGNVWVPSVGRDGVRLGRRLNTMSIERPLRNY